MITLVGKVFVLLLIAFFGIYNLAIGKYTALENAFEGSSSNAGGGPPWGAKITDEGLSEHSVH